VSCFVCANDVLEMANAKSKAIDNDFIL